MNLRLGLLFLFVFTALDISASYIDEMRSTISVKMLKDLEAAKQLSGQKSMVSEIEAELEHDLSVFGLDCEEQKLKSTTVRKIVGGLTRYAFALGEISKGSADALYVVNITMDKDEIYKVALILGTFIFNDEMFVDRYENARKNFFLNQYLEEQRKAREEAMGEEVDVVAKGAMRREGKLVNIKK